MVEILISFTVDVLYFLNFWNAFLTGSLFRKSIFNWSSDSFSNSHKFDAEHVSQISTSLHVVSIRHNVEYLKIFRYASLTSMVLFIHMACKNSSTLVSKYLCIRLKKRKSLLQFFLYWKCAHNIHLESLKEYDRTGRHERLFSLTLELFQDLQVHDCFARHYKVAHLNKKLRMVSIVKKYSSESNNSWYEWTGRMLRCHRKSFQKILSAHRRPLERQ